MLRTGFTSSTKNVDCYSQPAAPDGPRKTNPMRLLLTNDDGLDSENLNSLYTRLSSDHDVWVVAPDVERSGSSHAMTLKHPIDVRKRDARQFACSGTPVDCVLLAVLGLVDMPIDMVLSGPNAGPNLGTDIIYSGTAAAARQAVLMGVPGVAASLTDHITRRGRDYAVEFLARNLALFQDLSSEDHFLNINFPDHVDNGIDIRITPPSVRIYNDILDIENRHDGSLRCRILGPRPEARPQKGSDHDVVNAGSISLSPVYTHPVNHRVENRYQKAAFWVRES